MTQFALAFLDCEFGGLDPDRHDITEIGVIVTDYRLAELASREWKVLARPDRVTSEAAAIFGYDPDRWAREGVRWQGPGSPVRPGQDPLGKSIQMGSRNNDGAPRLAVVGVVKDGKYVTLGEGATPFFYLNLAQGYQSAPTLVVRTRGNPFDHLAAVRNEVGALGCARTDRVGPEPARVER